MLTYLRYFQARYLGQKGQGMVEYAVIVAVVIAIGVALVDTGDGTIAGIISGVYTSVFEKAKAIGTTTTAP